MTIPLLSVCIPAYNHGDKLYANVQALLKHAGDFGGIEIVVSDNASQDNTLALLNGIKDNRLKVSTSPLNIKAQANYIRALAAASGKYVLFLIDKDQLDFTHFDLILAYLRQNDFALGAFAINYSGTPEIERYKTLTKKILNFAYLSRHPSGYIFRNEFFKKIDVEQSFADFQKTGWFPLEFICAEIAKFNLPGIIFNIPFVIMPIDKKTSISYRPENDNLFFTPANRYLQFDKYLRHLNILKLPFLTKRLLLKRLIKDTYDNYTSIYKFYLETPDFATHYYLNPRIMPDGELANLKNEFISKLWAQTNISGPNKLAGLLKITGFKGLISVLKETALCKKS